MAERTVCVVTGSRAEYGLLYWLMKEIVADPDLDLQLVVTGTHLAPRFGETFKAIEEGGFTIDERVDIEVGDDTASGVARSLGLAVIGMGHAFDRLNPDILVLLGDRYEILAAAQAALIARIPIAHIHGGEITEGAMDDAMRHAITKMAHLHFTAADSYRARVIQLGENPENVFNVGAPGLDNIERLDLLDRAGLDGVLGVSLDRRYFLVTYHPATLGNCDSVQEAGAMLDALDRFGDHRVVITGVNADPGHQSVQSLLIAYARAGEERVTFHESLGQRHYLSVMKHADAVIGNSSSGIIEAPALGVPTINIGDRQKGRLRASSILDCPGIADEIAANIRQAIQPDFLENLETFLPPYGAGGASRKIKNLIKSADLTNIVRKSFWDAAALKAVS